MASGGQTPPRKSAGARRHRVALQQGVSTLDALRGRTQTWTTYATVWAAIDEMPAVVSETQATVLYQVTLLFRADTFAKYLAGTQQQVLTTQKALKVIEVVNPDERNLDLVLYCALAPRAAA